MATSKIEIRTDQSLKEEAATRYATQADWDRFSG